MENLFESAASIAARGMHLEYYGFGRWGNQRFVTHHTVNGVLVPYVRKQPKVKLEAKPASVAPHPQVYEDENIMFHNTAVKQKEFSEKLPMNAKSACLYSQVLHSIAIQTGESVHDMLKVYNPVGDDLYGVSLPKIIRGFKRVQVDGKNLDPKIYSADGIDDAINMVRHGKPVICMIKTFGALMMSMSAKKKKEFKADNHVEINKPDVSDRQQLFHALMLVGYDKAKNRVLFRDSESAYAKDGFLSIDYDYFKKTHPDEILSFLHVSPN